MTKIREKSQYILGAFLVIFLASLSLGGLVGGANIIDLTIGKIYFMLGKDHPQHLTRYAGYAGDKWIERQEFERERSIQINFQRNNRGTDLDGQAILGAENSAWNRLVDETIQKPLIEKLGLKISNDELFQYILGAPIDLQNYFISQGLFVDEDENFILGDYQEAVRSGNFPLLEDQRQNYENNVRRTLPLRKLQEIFAATASTNIVELKNKYMNKNTNCIIEYSYVNSNSISDSLITVTKDEIKEEYNRTKDESYVIYPSRVVEYAYWKVDYEGIDSLFHTDHKDSIMDIAYQVMDEANISNLSQAIKINADTKLDTMELTLEYDNLSGVPYAFGVNRKLVRFAFDNPVGTISDIIQVKDGHLICQIIGNKDGSYKALEDIEASIKSRLIRDKKMEYAKNILSQAKENAMSTADIASFDEVIKYESDVEGTIGSSFKSIGSSSELKGTLKAMEVGETSEILEVSYNAVIVTMLEKDPFSNDDFDISLDELRKETLDEKKYLKYNERIYGFPLFNDYLSGVKDEIQIVDYRNKIY